MLLGGFCLRLLFQCLILSLSKLVFEALSFLHLHVLCHLGEVVILMLDVLGDHQVKGLVV